MFCYWGDEVIPGFGLVKADGVKKTSSGVFFCSPKSSIRRVAPGKGLVGFVRGEGNVSVISVPPAGGLQRDRLKSLQLKHKIRLMSCGETQAVLLTYAGKTLWMDQRRNCSPLKELSDRNVIQVVCGDHHCMALTHDGQLFTWGQNSNGQLGLGKDGLNFPSPQPLKSLCGVPLAQISAGGDHSFALSLSGAVFGWGRNSAGQLGLGDTEDRYTPTCVNSLSLKKTVFISCGEEHTATLSKGGTVFTFGSGRYGQLGHNSFRDEHRPRVVGELWGLKVSQITCGRYHTLVLDESSKTIYSFGCGEQGQLGNGQRTNQCVPLPVHLPPEANHNKSVEQIVAGGNHSFVLCSRQESDSGHPESTQGRGILTLGDQMINRWISECDSDQWMTIMKEIKTVFSSAACLNGSFIKKSCDGHYQTSASFSGLDVESVRAAFERLAKKEKVLLEIEKTVGKDLFPSLGSTAVGAEGLRVYLILPELLRALNKPPNETKLTSKLASAFLKLDPPTLQTLENLWSELPDDFLKPLVELFRKPCSDYISQMSLLPQAKAYDKFLRKSVSVLQKLYKAFCRGQREMTPQDFIIYEINDLYDMLEAVCHDLYDFNFFGDVLTMFKDKEYLEHTLHLLNSSPCIFNLEAKCNLLKFRKVSVRFRLVLRRTALLEDCFAQLRAADESALKGRLQVVYSEKHENTDVNRKDFFHHAFCTLMTSESSMFMYNDTKTLIWFPAEQPGLEEDNYFVFGCLCGLAFYNNGVVNLPFPLALFKKLLDIQPSLEDLTELSPVVGRCLQYILDYSDEDLDCMDMSFTIMWDNKEVELDPNEPGKVVTSSNKKEFVDAYIDYIMNKSVKWVFEEFKKGFYKVCDRKVVEFFQPEELRGVMVGSEEYDWSTLKKNASYDGVFHSKHPIIVSFWEVFDGWSDKEKKAFLLFVTGFDRVPYLGMDQVKIKMIYWGELSSPECAGADPRFGEGLKRMIGSDRLSGLSVKHSLLALLTPDGKVAVVSPNGQSEKGQRKTQTNGGGEAKSLSNRFILPLKGKIQHLSSGKHHVVLVSQEGTVGEWSEQAFKARAFSSLTNRLIAQVACGNDHSVVLTQDGQLFTWGQNSSGQLGLGKGEPSSLSPQLLRSLGGIPLAQISTGGDHSFGLSHSGAVFGWGRNSAGQLGLGDREDRYVPVCVKSLNQKKTVFISCGEDHTAVLTKGGVLFTFGSGCYGQLGHNSLRDEHRPRLLGGLWGSKVTQIACGRHHTLALVGSSNTIYSFGCGEQGQLGNGERSNQCVPLPVHLPPESKPNQTVETIMAGGNLSVVCCKAGELISARSCTGTAGLDDEMIDRWILGCEKEKAWKTVKRTVSAYSSPMLFMCFISGNKHYKTSEGQSGLDLSLARLAFERLARKQKVLLEVESVVERDLLPSLGSTTAGVEALRVYLILPELLRVLNKGQRGTNLTVALASAILKLDQESMRVIGGLWTTLPYCYYRTLVKIFNSVCGHFMSQMTNKICNHWDETSPLLNILQELYDIPLYPGDQQKAAVLQNFMTNVDILRSYPFILDMSSKCKLFRGRQKWSAVLQPAGNRLCVRREEVLADTLTYLKTTPPDFSFPLKVTFHLEDGYDVGGLCTEFFTLLGQKIKDVSRVIQASEDSGLFWFSADSTGTTDELYYLGVICGMAFYNQCYLNIGFPLALFKKLLHQSPTLCDLEELSPVEARCLRDLLMADEEAVEMFYLDFTVQDKELIPNGREIPVTKVNRQKYVDLYLDFFFNKAVEHQFKEFERGFSCGNYSDFWKMFLPEELRLLLYGTADYEWEKLQEVAAYEDCGPWDELIINFWTVFLELSEEHKMKFLIFMYATKRLPIGGLSQRQLKLVKRDYVDSDERYPVAQTCFGILELPNYSSARILRERLIHAITHCEVFGKQ
ncbi:hypothetical protein NFI96_014103 [Prochilodus magdalenae]|nr:hypothetical protein NFI96_014103 [Prochilodus magdalenae]